MNIEKKIKETIEQSDHFVTFKDTNCVIQYPDRDDMFFYQGIPEVTSLKNIIGTDVFWFEKHNPYTSKDYGEVQHIFEYYAIKTGFNPQAQENIILMLPSGKLILFDRWQEIFIVNKKIIGIYSHIRLKKPNHSMHLFDLYENYFFEEPRKGIDIFVERFKLDKVYPGKPLSISTIREILYDFEIHRLQTYLPDITPQARANNRAKMQHTIKESLPLRDQWIQENLDSSFFEKELLRVKKET